MHPFRGKVASAELSSAVFLPPGMGAQRCLLEPEGLHRTALAPREPLPSIHAIHEADKALCYSA